jgi:hypothetical protein
VHVPEGLGDAAVAHGDGHLVQRFGQVGPKAPVVFGVTHVGARVALDGAVEVGELQRVAVKEHRRVVADHIPVAFGGVEPQRVAADIALGVGGAALAGHRGEPGEHLTAVADLAEDRRLRVPGDVVGHPKRAEGTRTLGVHTALGDDFAGEVGELLDKPQILQEQRTARPGAHAVLVVGDGRSRRGGQRFGVFFECHFLFLGGG